MEIGGNGGLVEYLELDTKRILGPLSRAGDEVPKLEVTHNFDPLWRRKGGVGMVLSYSGGQGVDSASLEAGDETRVCTFLEI